MCPVNSPGQNAGDRENRLHTAWITLAAIASGYGLGCVSPAYWLVRWRTGRDIRACGTGTAGATNAGRLLGRGGFVAVALADCGKGALAVAIARWLGAGVHGEGAAMVAAVLGHAFPAPLGLRGGKSVSVTGGAVACFAPWGVAWWAAVVLFGKAMRLRTTSAALTAFAAAPAGLAAQGGWLQAAWVAAAALVVIALHVPSLRAAAVSEPQGEPA